MNKTMTNFSKDLSQLFVLALNATLYNYRHIYLFIYFNLQFGFN